MLFPRPRLGAARVYLIHTCVQVFTFRLYVAVNLIWQAQVAGLSPLELVLVGTVLELTAFLFEIPTGVVADVFSRRLSVIIGVLLGSVAGFIEALFPVFAAILLAQVVSAIGYTFISGARSAWITDEIGEDAIGPIFLRAAQLGRATSLLALPFAVLLGTFALNLPMLVSAGVAYALGLFLILFMPETGFRPVPREGRAGWRSMVGTTAAAARHVRGRPRLLALFAIAAFFGMASEGLDRLSTPHVLRDIGLPTIGDLGPVAWFGLISLGNNLIAIAGAEVIRRRLDSTDDASTARLLFLLNAGQVASAVLFAAATGFPLAVALWWTLGLFRQLFVPVFDAWINRGIEPSVRATVLSMQSQCDALGQMIGGPIVGAIGSAVSISAALVTSGLMLAPALPLYARTRRGRPPINAVIGAGK